MRTALALAASALAALGGVAAALSDTTIVPFYLGLTFVGGVQAAVTYPPYLGRRRQAAQGLALLWLIAAVWVGVLLLLYNTAWGDIVAPPGPTVLFLGLPATVFHLIGLYGGAALSLASAFGAGRRDPAGSSKESVSPG
jgi:hypothetical protein